MQILTNINFSAGSYMRSRSFLGLRWEKKIWRAFQVVSWRNMTHFGYYKLFSMFEVSVVEKEQREKQAWARWQKALMTKIHLYLHKDNSQIFISRSGLCLDFRHIIYNCFLIISHVHSIIFLKIICSNWNTFSPFLSVPLPLPIPDF